MKTFMMTLALALFAYMPASFAAMGADRTEPGNDIVGTILEVEGLATVTMPNARPGPATVNMAVHPHDIVATGPRARVFIQLMDNTELTLGENGEMTIDDYAFDDQDDTDNHAVYSILKGAFLYVSGLVAKKEDPDVTVNIPYGSIGIRGTKFWGGKIDAEYGVIVGEGTIVVDTGAGKATLNKGQGTMIKDKGYAPGPVKTWEQTKIDRATATVALKAPAVIGERMKENAERNLLLRERHREILNLRTEKTLEEKSGESSSSFQDSMDKDRASKRLIELRREKEKRLNGSPSSSAAPIVPAAPVIPLGNTLSTTVDGTRTPTSIIRATPLRGSVQSTTTVTEPATSAVGDAVKTTTEVTKSVGENAVGTVETTVEKTTETVEKATTPVLDTVEKTTRAVEKPVESTTSTVKNTTTTTVKKILKPQ